MCVENKIDLAIQHIVNRMGTPLHDLVDRFGFDPGCVERICCAAGGDQCKAKVFQVLQIGSISGLSSSLTEMNTAPCRQGNAGTELAAGKGTGKISADAHDLAR